MKVGLTTFAAFAFMLNAAALRADGGDTSLIHACVAKDGTMRIVSATTACKNNETALHWATAARVSAIEATDASQDSAISATQSTNAAQDSAITAIRAKNDEQDATIAALQGDSGGTSGAVITPPIPPYVFGSWSSVSFTSSNTVYDTDSYVGANKFVVPQSGIYLLTMWAINLQDSTFVALAYKVNGGNLREICLSLGSTGAYPFCNGSDLLNLNAGDTIEFAVYPSANALGGLRIGISKQ